MVLDAMTLNEFFTVEAREDDTCGICRPWWLQQKWQNDSLYGAADTMDDGARKLDSGAFFGSIHGTLNHIFWGDRMWIVDLPVLSATEFAESVEECGEWPDLKSAREQMDQAINYWATGLDEERLAGDPSWFSGALQADASKPM